MQNIFREEALQSIANNHKGDVLSLPSGVLRFFVFALSLFFLILIGVFFTVEYSRYELVTGVLVSTDNSSRLTSQRSGILREIHVEEGQTVAAGDILLSIIPHEFDLAGNNTVSLVIDELRQSVEFTQLREEKEIAKFRLQTVRWNHEKTLLEAQEKRQKQLLNAQQQKVDLLEKDRNATQRLYETSKVTRIEYSEVEKQYLDSKITLNVHQKELEDLAFRLRTLDTDRNMSSFEHQSVLQGLRLARSELKREMLGLQAQSGIQLRAPVTGVVSGLLLQKGSSIDIGDFLLSIVPQRAELVAEVYVESKAISYISEDSEVKVRYAPYPFEKFGSYAASVDTISKTVILPKDHSDRSGLKAPAYVVYLNLKQQYVEHNDTQLPLYPGTEVEAYLASEKRTLAEWLFRPFLSLALRN